MFIQNAAGIRADRGALVPALIAYGRCLHLLGTPSVRLVELGVRWFTLP